MKATGTSPAASSFTLKGNNKEESEHSFLWLEINTSWAQREGRGIYYIPNDGGVLDLRVRDEEGLELRGRHLEPLVLDDLLEPVDDEDLVVVVHEADVSGVQPPVLVDGVLRRLRVVQVTCGIVLVSLSK